MKFIFLALNLFLTSCMSTKSYEEKSLPGHYYRVKPGDTLSLIARSHGVNSAEIMETNGIVDARFIKPGQELFLPDGDPIGTKVRSLLRLATTKTAPKLPIKSHDKSHDKPRDKPEAPKAHAQKSLPTLDFPVPGGSIIREFAHVKQSPYDGIGIKASLGTKVLAAQKGRVLFVGDDGTRFGLLVIIEHEADLVTVYTHLDKALVATNAQVERSMPIGTVGRSGGAQFAHLHFQVRLNQQPKNPRHYFGDFITRHSEFRK